MSDQPNPDGRPPESTLAAAFRMRNLGGFLRGVGACAVVAAMLGILVTPGIHGSASDAVVNIWDRAAAVFEYATLILVTEGLVSSTTEIVLSRRAESLSGAVLVGGTSLVVVLVIVATCRARMFPDAPAHEQLTLGLAVMASIVASVGGVRAMRAPHTRALAFVLSIFATAAMVRVGAWEMARIAGDNSSVGLYEGARAASTLRVVIEAFGQLAAAVWIGTRGRVGLVLSTAAAGLAFALTWGAALGAHADAPSWMAVLHASLAATSSSPAPYALSGAASYLTASGILLAAVSLAILEQPAAITVALALALLSRGALDVPLRALAIVAASQWAVVASFDDRLMWASLLTSRRAETAGASPSAGAKG
ncbi:MAG TPA: hypothetical protein VGI39_27460 [Polyangiaceae bacterium]|jgi:hypothetical protein